LTEEHAAQCPYCGEPIVLELDLSAGSQVYTEDCAVCCQPIRVALRVAPDGSYTVDIDREND
jgi:transcription elongation factor Elf1